MRLDFFAKLRLGGFSRALWTPDHTMRESARISRREFFRRGKLTPQRINAAKRTAADGFSRRPKRNVLAHSKDAGAISQRRTGAAKRTSTIRQSRKRAVARDGFQQIVWTVEKARRARCVEARISNRPRRRVRWSEAILRQKFHFSEQNRFCAVFVLGNLGDFSKKLLNIPGFFKLHQRRNCRRRNSKILGASPGKEPAALFTSLRTPWGSSQNLFLGARPQRQQMTRHRHERLPKNLRKAREGRNPSRIFNHTQQRVRVGRDDLRGGKSPFQN